MKRFDTCLLIIVFLAIFFRFNNLNWDSNFHLHPDERFLTMVGNAMTMPMSFKEYFNPVISTFNPANIGYKFYVYGIFPLVLNKIIALSTGADNYNFFTIQGRFLSAFFDILTLLFVFKITKLLENKYRFAKSIKYWAAFFYAIAVFPIQLSHFFAVDTFLNFFMLGSFYFVLKLSEPPRFQEPRGFLFLFFSAIFLGLALASKITAIYIFPLNFLFLFLGTNKNIKKFLILTSYYLILIYIVLRIADPYYFQSTNFFDPTLSVTFKSGIKQLQILSSREGSAFYPPAVQWQNKGPLFLLINTAVFGVGLPYFIFMIIGVFYIALSFLIKTNSKYQKNKIAINNWQLTIILLWVIGLFFYQSAQFVKTMRYTIYLYPFLAIIAAFGLRVILNLFQDLFNRFRIKSGMTLIYIVITILLIIWPVMFSSIYMRKNSRVEASEWIYQNLPNNSFILSEHWDDSLPLPMVNNYGKQFQGTQLPVFDPDTPEKWKKMEELLKKGDYYILSSNRAWGSVPTVPEKYPRMSKFYNNLLSNKTNYKLVKEFVSYPKISFFNFQFSIADDWSEELFTVYDHPKVLIYKKI